MDGNKSTIVKIYKHIFFFLKKRKKIYKLMYVPSNSEVLGSSDTPAAHYFPARISLQLDGSAHQSLLQATLCISQHQFSQVQ